MTVIGNFIAIRPDQLAAVVEDPDLVSSFLYPEGGGVGPTNQLDMACHSPHAQWKQL